MDEAKKREIEAKLRQLIAHADRGQDDSQPAKPRTTSGIRVIRRRKGAPDLQIA